MASQSSQAKTAIIQSLVKDWHKDKAKKKLNQVMELFVDYSESYISVTSGIVRKLVDLQSS